MRSAALKGHTDTRWSCTNTIMWRIWTYCFLEWILARKWRKANLMAKTDCREILLRIVLPVFEQDFLHTKEMERNPFWSLPIPQKFLHTLLHLHNDWSPRMQTSEPLPHSLYIRFSAAASPQAHSNFPMSEDLATSYMLPYTMSAECATRVPTF